MTATEQIEIPLPRPEVRPRSALAQQKSATAIVNTLLDDEPPVEGPVCEASVHLPQRSRVWVAAFTGHNGGQVWRSTGLTDHDQALVLAKHWEAKARAQRLGLGRPLQRPILRVRREEPGTVSSGMLTQREVARLLNMSERGVRAVERRAFEKLRQHPLLRQAWQRYLAGELDEHQLGLTPEESEALFNLIRTPEERGLIQKVLRLIQR